MRAIMQDNDEIQIDSESDLDDSVLAEEHQGDTIKKLKERLKDSEEKAKNSLDELQRAKADFINMRKRDEEAKSEFLKFANMGLIEGLVPVLDALSSAIAHGDKGVEQTYSLLVKTLGLSELDPKGETFDPSFHEAIGIIETDKKEEDHKILEVVQKGYILSGKVIRPAKVRIGEFKN
jgi:molecular chaperone GrpE